ncbi:MAG: hypothetical protein EOL87_03135 [Spartobacteria bacterium]|nr:hypothetical protein [Spartobacteria bacterium]
MNTISAEQVSVASMMKMMSEYRQASGIPSRPGVQSSVDSSQDQVDSVSVHQPQPIARRLGQHINIWA